MISAELSQFVHSLHSLWSIELLLLLHRDPERRWSIDDLVIELRSSRSLVDGILSRLHPMGLVERQSDGSYKYREASPALASLVDQLDGIYAERPLALVQEIHGEPDENLRAFSDAFKLKKD